MILLAVLGALGMIYIMIVQMSADVLFTARYYQKIIFKERAYYMSRSAYGAVSQLFNLDDARYDSLQDEWAKEIPPYHLQEENVYLSVKIVDLERYFNVNSIIKDNDHVDEKHLRQFRRLLDLLEMDPDLSNSLLDWMDSDQERRFPLGAEELDYEDITVKGGRLDSIEEIKLVKNFPPEAFKGKVSQNRMIPSLKDVLTAYSSGLVNVNTARSEILMSLDDEMTQELVAELIRRREENPFETMDDLLELPGMNHDLLFRLKQLADVKSEYFRVIITVENYDRESADLEVVIKRSGQSGRIVFWKAD